MIDVDGACPGIAQSLFLIEAQAGHPGLDVGGPARGCDAITGEFRVVSISALPGNMDASTPPQLTSFTATFRQSGGSGTPFDIGCLHFER